MSRKAIARSLALIFAGGVCSAVPAYAAHRPHMLVISIDGMRADYLTAADEHHLRIPTLRRLMANGAYAQGVVGVIPTYTYPSHTTLVTGVSPSVHGVYNNQKFDPLGTERGAVFTDYNMIKVKTLYAAAHAAGYTTASVGWPVTTGSQDIDWLLPANAAFEGKAADGERVDAPAAGVHFDHPAGLRETLASDVPPKPDLSIDERRFAWSMAILRRYKPEFMTTHLGELDHAEHITGPFSHESIDALEMLDGEVAQLLDAELRNDPRAYIVVVSDHGFEPVEKTVHLGVLFAGAGLLQRKSANGEGSWSAALWPSGGTAAVMLKDSSDPQVLHKVQAVLREAQGHPEYGIATVLSHDELLKRGANPAASYIIEFQPGYKIGNGVSGPVVTASPHTGNHGFLPDRPELYASFIIDGPGMPHHENIGVIDMRQIAPTLANLLHLSLPQATLPALNLKPR